MRKTFLRSSSLLALTCGVAFATTNLALAQDEAPAPRVVERIVVTAEKRAEDPQTAPIAVTVFDEAALRRGNVDEVDDLEFVTPSLTIATAGQANMMNLRGIGKYDAGGTSTSAVATYRDGVGTVSGFFNHEPYYDIESVEVLRGPQGTYVGENAAGGAIFVNTRDPNIDGPFGGYVQAGIGNYDTHEVQGGINIPLDDWIAARVSFRHVDRDSFFTVLVDDPPPGGGFRENRAHPGDIDHNSLRASVLMEPIEQLSVLFKLDLHHLDHGGNVFTTYPGHPFQIGRLISPDLYTVGNNFEQVYAKDKMARGIMEVNYEFEDGGSIRWISGMQYINTHIRNDDDGSTAADVRIHIRPIFRVYTSEATYLSPEDQPFRWLFGAFYRSENLWFPDFDGFHIYFGPGFPGLDFLQIEWNSERQTAALYGQVAYDLTDDLEIVAGLRGQQYDMDQVVFTTLLGGPFNGGLRDDGYDEDAITYKVALNWEASDEHYFYAFVATGNTTGGKGVTNPNPLGVPLLPRTSFTNQKTTDYEAGWKGTLLDGQLLTQVGGFYTVVEDFQMTVSEIVVPVPLTTRSAFTNIDDDTILYGIEAQAQAKIDDLGIDFNASWIHSEMGSEVIRDDVTGTLIDIGGNKVPWTPEWTVNIGVDYDFHVWGDATLTPRITYSFVDWQTSTPLDRFSVVTGVFFDRIPEHDIVNLQLTFAMENWLAQLYWTNAAEEQYIQGISGDNIFDPDVYVNEPMRYGLRVTMNFGEE